MNTLSMLLLGLIVSVIAILLKTIKSEYALFIVFCGGILIFSFALTQVKEIFGFISDIQKQTKGISDYLITIFKIIGICIFGELATSVCADNHHSVLVSAMNFLCRASVMVLALPIFKDILKIIGEMLG